MTRPPERRPGTRCSFCGKDQTQVRKLVAGPGAYICDQCIELCNEVLESAGAPAQPGTWLQRAIRPGPLAHRRVALAVTGGIAAFKAVECLRLLTEAGAEVRVLMTPEATRFVGPLTFEALSYHPVTADWLDPRGGGESHITISEWAEAVVVAPATANTLARLALGLADEVVSATVLASRAPLILAPAMNDLMLTHPETQEHLRILRERGAHLVAPAEGRLASGKIAVGRLAAPERIVAVVRAALAGRRNLTGWRVVVSAGGTREPLDPVRYLGNSSSGKMGRALAEVAEARGADVILVTTIPLDLEGIHEVRVDTAAEMLIALKEACADAQVLVMAAAVSDYRPRAAAAAKIKRRDAPLPVELVQSVDILAELGRPPGLFRVGFKAETEELEQRARAKLADYQLDLVVANLVGPEGGMGSDENAVTIIGPHGVVASTPRLPKLEVAELIWDAVHTARTRPD